MRIIYRGYLSDNVRSFKGRVRRLSLLSKKSGLVVPKRRWVFKDCNHGCEFYTIYLEVNFIVRSASKDFTDLTSGNLCHIAKSIALF